MNTFINLVSQGSLPLSTSLVEDSRESLAKLGPNGIMLSNLLSLKNGFYCFNSSLLVRPAGIDECFRPRTLTTWNDKDCWKLWFNLDLMPYYCFAEDVFGVQFCIGNNGIYSFDPETAEIESIVEYLDQFVTRILDDTDNITGQPFAIEWKRRNGDLLQGFRLCAKVPFVCGGAYTSENLSQVDELTGMHRRAEIANQLKDLPDGDSIVFRYED